MPAFIMGVGGTSATLQTKSITLNGTYNASSDDADGYSTVTVNVQPSLQTKSITPTTSEQQITADEGYYGLSQVTIDPIPSQYIIPTGTIPITSNGTVDVKNYEYANVNVGGGGGELFQKLLDKSITSVSSSDFGNITSIGDYAFYNCTSLTSIIIPNIITSIGIHAFEGCSGLTSITIPNNITIINNYTFRSCNGINTTVIIPDSVTTIGQYAFAGTGSTISTRMNVTEYRIGSGVTNIQNSAFRYNTQLQSITITATTPPTLGSSALASTGSGPIYVPAASLEAYQAAWGDVASRITAIQ